jgi:hypothetical protein
VNVIVVIEEVKDQDELQAMSRYPLKHTVVLVHFESPTEMFFCLSICQQNKKVLMTTYVFILSAADSVGATFHDSIQNRRHIGTSRFVIQSNCHEGKLLNYPQSIVKTPAKKIGISTRN